MDTTGPDPRTSAVLADAYAPQNNPMLLVFRALGWGDFNNVGYYTPLTLPRLAFGLKPFQEALVERSLGLLDIQPGHLVLDVACGTGHTTRRIADRGALATGIDLHFPHLDQARRLHDHHPRIRFEHLDATTLSTPADRAGNSAFGDATFDRIHCLEAAFHFGPDGRRTFLEQAHHILKPGGRLVVVDVAWATENAAEIGAADPHRTVRNTWAFEEFEPVTRYLHNATAIGFRLRLHDWSRPVTHWCKILGTLTSRIARTSAGRRLLALRWPALRHLTTAQWDAFADTTEAHIAVAAHTRYIALVLDKPNPA